MTNTDTPRPSADEIRALVADTRCEIDDDMYRYDAWAKKRFDALCAAVESLLEDRELLDGLERELKVAGSVDFVGVTPGTVRVYTFQRDYEGPTLRDALREAVGA